MAVERHLEWDGCYNVRDLGGLPTSDGRQTRRGVFVRADSINRLRPAGWDALWAYGIRTVIDLRNGDELHATPYLAARPVGLTTLHVPPDDSADTEFWRYCWENELDGSPLYYQPFLDRKSERCAAAIRAVAGAAAGGVLTHCGAGRDRTGIVSLLLLALAGVETEAIVADYELSNLRLTPLWLALGRSDQGPIVADILARKNTTARALLLDLLAALDASAYLHSAGVSDGDLAAIRARFVGPPLVAHD